MSFERIKLKNLEIVWTNETVIAGGGDAVVTRVGARAWLTGVSHYGSDPDDPFPHGYRLNDHLARLLIALAGRSANGD